MHFSNWKVVTYILKYPYQATMRYVSTLGKKQKKKHLTLFEGIRCFLFYCMNGFVKLFLKKAIWHFQHALRGPNCLQNEPCVYQRNIKISQNMFTFTWLKTFYNTKVTYFMDQMNPLILIAWMDRHLKESVSNR